MEKAIIACVAALLLSAGVAVAQSNSGQSSMSAGTSASTQADAGTTATAPKKARQAAAHYPKAEAKLNSEEALQTKQLNIQAGASASGSTQP